MTAAADEHEHRFWECAASVLGRPGVARSTMMGLPCLRVNGAFFASFDRRTGDLLVKLPEGQVDHLIASGQAHAFAPAGRRFREWAAIGADAEPLWSSMIDDALAHVSSLPAPAPKPSRRR